MTNETFFNIEFYRTLLSVLIGGIISLSSVLVVEFFKKRRERKERKRLIYTGLITTINQMRRIEIKGVLGSIGFHYQKRYFEISGDEIAKQQADYNQKINDECNDQIIAKAETLDSYSIDYEVYFGEDKVFDKIMYTINNWPRPESPDYSSIKSLSELDKQLDIDYKSSKEKANIYWRNAVSKISTHVLKQL